MLECPEGVYFPSEDSYFLAENVSVQKGSVVFDVGCGSGIQGINALLQGASKVFGFDVGAKALETAQKNCENAGFAGKFFPVQSDLFEKCAWKADAIIFNPPYLESEGIKFADLEGGKKGREVLDRFLGEFPKFLTENGKCFFLQTDLNGYRQTIGKLEGEGFVAEIAARKRGFFEELAVFCTRKRARKEA